jgi:uncharacterized protein
MKFQLDTAAGGNLLTRVEPGCVWVNGQPHRSPVVVPWAGAVSPWPVNGFDDLRAEHFDALLALKPELVLLGTGARLRFAHPSLTQSLMRAGIGVDCMDVAAACRTYSVLTAEGRKVLAALIPA